jgi:tetratricopeptide (TPR) repeat protein
MPLTPRVAADEPAAVSGFLARVPVWLALALGQDERARRRLDALLLIDPHHAWALASRSVIHQRAGRLALALIDAQALVGTPWLMQATPPRAAAAWFNLGFLLEQSGQPAPALAAFERACELAPELDRAWYGLALAAIRLGRPARAEAALRQCTLLQPMGPHAWYQLVRLLADGGRMMEAAAAVDHLQGFEPAVAAQLRAEVGLRKAPA